MPFQTRLAIGRKRGQFLGVLHTIWVSGPGSFKRRKKVRRLRTWQGRSSLILRTCAVRPHRPSILSAHVRCSWSELTDVIKLFILQRAAAAKNAHDRSVCIDLMHVLTVRASCGGGKKAKSRRQVSLNVLVLRSLVG